MFSHVNCLTRAKCFITGYLAIFFLASINTVWVPKCRGGMSLGLMQTPLFLRVEASPSLYQKHALIHRSIVSESGNRLLVLPNGITNHSPAIVPAVKCPLLSIHQSLYGHFLSRKGRFRWVLLFLYVNILPDAPLTRRRVNCGNMDNKDREFSTQYRNSPWNPFGCLSA